MKNQNLKSYIIPILVGLIIAIVGIISGYFFSQKGIQFEKGDTVITELDDQGEFSSILFGQDEYELNYNNLDSDSVEIISRFEPGEAWQGEGFWDKRIFIEGESSLALNSSDHQIAKVYYDFLEAKDFSEVKFIDFYLNLSDGQLLESASLKIGDDNLENYYVYSLSNLKLNWNVVQVPVDQMVKISKDEGFDLSGIKKLQIELLSRPQQSVVANLDFLTIVRNNNYLDDWQINQDQFLSIGKLNDRVVLIGKRLDSYEATLSQVSGVKDFVYEAQVSPQTTSTSGLFFRGSYKNGKGYYFTVSGVNGNNWSLRKNSSDGWEDLIKGEISNFSFDSEKFYWLRVVTNGSKISLYFSINGEDFTQLAEVTDDEFLSGGVGITVFGGYSYFDNFKIKK